MNDYKDKLYWNDICEFQKLSEPFIKRHLGKLDIDYILIKQDLSKEFLIENKQFFELFLSAVGKNIFYEKIGDNINEATRQKNKL
jgi:hypothetical protein